MPGLSNNLEKVLNFRLFTNQNILAINQFGFRNTKSTEDALAFLKDNLINKMDKKQRCIGIFLNLAKAFDSVHVFKLMTKINKVGFRGYSLKIFESYLGDRTQYVKIGSITSKFNSLSYGVPQGSILGPTLFLIYIN